MRKRPYEGGVLSHSRRAEIAAGLYEAVLTCFAHWEAIPDVDFDATFRAYLDEAFETVNRIAFDLATLRFVASLRNGHTAFSDDWLWLEHGAPVGFDARLDDRGWHVTRSAVAEIVPGTRIIQIDGQPAERFAKTRLAFVSGSSMRERESRLFARPYLFPRSFDVLAANGQSHNVLRGAKLPERSMEPEGNWVVRDRQFRLTIPSFAAPEFEAEAIGLVRALAEEVHLTIDIRGNGGGTTPCDLVAALMPVPYRFWQYATPATSGLERALGRPPRMITTEASWVEPRHDAFRGPITIVVDAGTYSAAEDFVLPFKDNARARIEGEATGGSSGQPYVRDFGDGMRLWVSSKRQYLPNGDAFEGVGLLPDAVGLTVDHSVAH